MLQISSRKSRPETGFALIIALSLMSFVLLLLLSITTLVKVETQSSEISLKQLGAKQNALLGLQAAIGDIQKLTGPDQRTSVAAEIFDADPTTELPDSLKHPNWIGIWNTDPGVSSSGELHLNKRFDIDSQYYNYTERRNGTDNRFLGWLISGSVQDKANIDLRNDTLPASDSIQLVGNDFDTSDTLQEANQVEVPRVKIRGRDDSTTGNYAYWVGDENTKAKIRSYSEKPITVAAEDINRARFATSQRHGIEHVDSSNQLLSNITGLESELTKINSTEGLSVLSSVQSSNQDVIENFINRNIHSLTAHSNSLLTNTMAGGLKTDLSNLLRTATATGFTPPNGLPAFADGAQFNFVKYPTTSSGFEVPDAPTWEQLISFYQDAETEGTPHTIQKKTRQQQGIFPIITRFRLDMIPLFERGSPQDSFYLCLAPVIILSNPHNVSLQIPANELYADFLIEDRNKSEDTGLFIASDWIKNYTPGTILTEAFAPSSPGKYSSYPYGVSDVPNLLDNGNLTEFTDSNGRSYSGFRFKFPSTTLAPGEVKAFGIANDGELYNGDNSLEEGAFDTNPKMVRLLNADENGDELKASVEWSSADNSDASKAIHAPGLPPNDVVYREQGALQLNADISSQTDPRRAAPFNLTIGLSSGSLTDLNDDDFYYLAEGIQSTNPNANMLYVWSTAQGRNQRSSVVEGIDDYTGMTKRATRFDVALGAAFEYPDNNNTYPAQENNSIYYGYLINSRWLRSNNPFAPRVKLSAGDDPASPNQLYGAVASFSPWAENSSLNMHNPEISMLGEKAYWGSGISLSDGGVNTVTFIELPRSDIGILSLAQLQNFQISDYSHDSFFGIGSGIAPLRIEALDKLVAPTLVTNPLSGSLHPIDTAFLVNDALWDQFYFSGLQADLTASDLSSYDSIPLNDNYNLVKNPELSRINDSQQNASELMVNGGFNINSTKVEAWKALLAGSNQLAFDPISGNASGNLETPISRFVYPMASSSSSINDLFNGFRELSDSELEDLAKAIVAEVKARGPFLSLSDFVNRRLQTADRNQGLYSALESAIRKSGINATLGGDNYTESDTPSNFNLPSNYITEVFDGNFREGIAQWIQQADILQRIAPLISARSDTFKIRAYGEVIDLDGNVVSALCEAVVQRQYDYLNDSNTDDAANYVFDTSTETYLETPLNTLNQMFGRKYKIVDFKWL